MQTSYTHTPTRFIKVNGKPVAYRSIGNASATPIIYLNHLAANLDGCDPLIMDNLAQHFTIVSFDYAGMGFSGGRPALHVEDMAQQTIDFIQALGYNKVHLLGLSLGGFVAQSILQKASHLVESVILAGTGPAGDKRIARVPRITFYDMLRAMLTNNDARYYLFFPTTQAARLQAKAFIARTRLRKDKDKPTTLPALLRQLRCVVRWAKSAPHNFETITHRVWVVNGDNDRMVPTAGSHELARQLPNASLTIYKGAGHGAIFQEAELFSQQAIAFYKANTPTTKA